MGGLREKMPITFWAFLIGGFALSGFPLITAGFWSKDEIFAKAWYTWGKGEPMALVVFIVLALAAFLTAFYTMRQISLTFLGEPRTEAAEHAVESNRFMTVPLIMLSIPAIFAGFAGIPDHFLGLDLGRINFFHHFVGATLYEPLNELYELGLVANRIDNIDWSWIPIIASFTVALGGLGLGYWVYGRKPLKADQPDPLIAALGPVHTFLRNKWYWDELYAAIFIRPAVVFSEKVVYEIVDRGLIDGILHLVANIFFAAGRVARQIEHFIFNVLVDGAKDLFLRFSQEARQIQTGKIQEYALVSSVIASALAFLILAIVNGWLDAILPFAGG